MEAIKEQETTLIRRIAHRGFSSQAPENTEAAFALAVEGDFYGIECDIWKSSDGRFVVSHDGNLKRMCGENISIPDTTFLQIHACEISAGKRRTFHPVQHPCSLESYLSILARSETVCPVIELKMDYPKADLEQILALTDRYGLYERTHFISMYPAVLLRLKKEMHFPAERLQYVYGVPWQLKFRPVSVELERWLIENRINLDTRYTLLSAANVMRLHREGLLVNVWTVNKKKDFDRLAYEYGVDMITTEYYF